MRAAARRAPANEKLWGGAWGHSFSALFGPQGHSSPPESARAAGAKRRGERPRTRDSGVEFEAIRLGQG
eukprot:14842411-Alexandrium_andersonii.AAC.1